MADPERIREAIRDIAQRRRNVTLDEIQWVVNQLQEHYATAVRKARHGVLFRVGDQRFMVNTHNPDFIDAMIELGWYED